MAIDLSGLAGQRVLITGGTTGIGRATLDLLAGAGARVFVFGRDPQALADALDGVRGAPGEARGITADVAKADDIEQVFAAVDKAFGGLDILIANAAIGAEPIDEMAEPDWRYVVEANVVGAMSCARAAVARMKDQGGGQIVLIGSISADHKRSGESVYAPTKAAVRTFGETLRKEVAESRIRVCVIDLGSVDTDMQQDDAAAKREAVHNGEMLPAADVADAIGFVLTRPPACNIGHMHIEPIMQHRE